MSSKEWARDLLPSVVPLSTSEQDNVRYESIDKARLHAPAAGEQEQGELHSNYFQTRSISICSPLASLTATKWPLDDGSR